MTPEAEPAEVAGEPGSEPRYRNRILLFLATTGMAVLLLSTTYSAIETLRRLDEVEAERDDWQRPGDILGELELGKGKVVADLGCGSGYFALKMAGLVGERGRIVAVDIRWLPLAFLRARALLAHRHNLTVIHAEPREPHLPRGALDAVLLANTYHEITDPDAILGSVLRALRPGGRLVIVDPSPGDGPHEGDGHHYESPDSAEGHLRRAGFEILSRQDRFIAHSPDGSWWLIVARTATASLAGDR